MLIAPPQDSGHQYIKSLAVLTDKLQDTALCAKLLEVENFDSLCQVLNES
jgi:mannitol/fructose-specific phosphotransferase system IIA component (Ntr-type)